MRALFVTPEMRPGGAQRVWASVMGGLAGRGMEVSLLCLDEEGTLFAEAGVPAACAGMRRRSDLAGLRRALRFARGRADVVVTRAVSAQLVGAIIARREHAAHVLNEHTPVTAAGQLLALRPHQRALTRLVARRVDGVVAVSRSQLEPLAARGYRRERIEVVPNGLFDGALTPVRRRAEVRAELGLAEADFAVLAPAALRAEKRLDVFLAAVERARAAVPTLRGLVAGDGAERRRLAPVAERAGARLLGERADMADLLAAADAVCLTSDAEALPISLLEAMELARPVVATRVGGVGEAVADGETGALAPPGDAAAVAAALVALARDPERARRLGAAGRERRRERFDGDRMVDGYLAALERAAAGR